MPEWTDAQLATADLSPAAIRCALAARSLSAQGTTPTVQALMGMLGLSKSSTYSARSELDHRFPGWRDPISSNGHQPESEISDRSALRDSRMSDTEPTLELEPVAGIPASPAIWGQAVATAYSASLGHKSWDLYETYAHAWDLVCEAPIPDRQVVAECIALTGNYIETLRGEPLDAHERASVALLARSHGKAALYGFSKALGATEEHRMRDWLVYARAVAQRTVGQFLRKPTEA